MGTEAGEPSREYLEAQAAASFDSPEGSRPAAQGRRSRLVTGDPSRAVVLWWAIFVALGVGYGLVTRLSSFLTQIALSLFIALAMEPAVSKLEGRGWSRARAALLVLVLLLAGIGVFLTTMGGLVANQIIDLVDNFPAYVTSVQNWADDQFGVQVDAAAINAQFESTEISSYADEVASNLLGFGLEALGFLFKMLTIAMFTYYFSADGPKLRRTVCELLPADRQHDVLRVWDIATVKTGGYVNSRLILAAISSLAHGIFFMLLDVPSPVALAIWVGLISQLIPVIGTYFAGILPVLVALADKPLNALWVILAVGLYQQIENYLIQPRVTARTLDMHPAIAFGAVIVGTTLSGASGALIALPTVATIGAVVGAYLRRHELVDHWLLGPGSVDPAVAEA